MKNNWLFTFNEYYFNYLLLQIIIQIYLTITMTMRINKKVAHHHTVQTMFYKSI